MRQLVDVKHRHRRAYAATTAAMRVPADYSVYLSMPFRSKQRRLSYFATGTDSFNKVQRGLYIPGAALRAAAQVTRAFIIQMGSARNPCDNDGKITASSPASPPEIIRRKLRRSNPPSNPDGVAKRFFSPLSTQYRRVDAV